jgi:hypothetical protein
VSITGNASLLAVTQTSQLTATATSSNGSMENVTSRANWETTDVAKVTVSPSGVITAHGFGAAEVRATYQGVSGTIFISIQQPSSGTLLKFDVAADVPSADLDSIKEGIAEAQSFLTSRLGGDIAVNQQLGITVKVVATGLGNQEPGGGGACCTGLDESGARPFFDVRNPGWNITARANGPWTITAEHEKTAAHEYTHGWAWSLGGITLHSKPLGDWLNEGIAEYVAYATLVSVGKMRASDADAFELSSAIYSGEASKCLAALENSNMSGTGLWPGHIGQVAVKALVNRSPNGVLSIRIVNENIGRRMTFEQAFENAFGIGKQDFYSSFPDYVASLGGPRSCPQ